MILISSYLFKMESVFFIWPPLNILSTLYLNSIQAFILYISTEILNKYL